MLPYAHDHHLVTIVLPETKQELLYKDNESTSACLNTERLFLPHATIQKSFIAGY